MKVHEKKYGEGLWTQKVNERMRRGYGLDGGGEGIDETEGSRDEDMDNDNSDTDQASGDEQDEEFSEKEGEYKEIGENEDIVEDDKLGGHDGNEDQKYKDICGNKKIYKDNLWHIVATDQEMPANDVVRRFAEYLKLFGEDPLCRIIMEKIIEAMNSGMRFQKALDLCVERFGHLIIDSAQDHWESMIRH